MVEYLPSNVQFGLTFSKRGNHAVSPKRSRPRSCYAGQPTQSKPSIMRKTFGSCRDNVRQVKRDVRRSTAMKFVARPCTPYTKARNQGIDYSLSAIRASTPRAPRTSCRITTRGTHAAHIFMYLHNYAVVQVRYSRLSPTQELAVCDSQSEPLPANLNARIPATWYGRCLVHSSILPVTLSCMCICRYVIAGIVSVKGSNGNARNGARGAL